MSLQLVIFLLFTSKNQVWALIPGQIMMDPQNRSFMVYNRDANGDGELDPFFMCGAGEPEEFLYTEGTTYVQANDVINKMIGTGANAIYFQIIRTGGDIRPGQPTKQDPFINNNPATPGANIDLIRQWKSKWLDKMDQNGITMFVFFYDDGVSLGSNNEQFFADVVNELENYKHLIWIVGEESREAMGDATVNKIADWIRKYDDNDHPVGNHQLNGITFNTPSLDVFAIQYNSGDLHQAMVNAWNNARGRYNNVMSESKASFGLDPVSLRKFHWSIAMAGAYLTELDWWYWGDINRAPSPEELKNCGNMRKFFESTTFNRMAPSDSLKYADTDYVLAQPGVSYIVYTDNYGSGIGLTNMSSGVYNLVWYDIVNNKYITQNGVSIGSGTQVWTRPSGISGKEIALFLKKISGGGTTPTPQSSPTMLPSPSAPANQAPVAQSQNLSVNSGKPLDIQLIYEDPDGPGPYTVNIIQQPAHGTLTGNNNDWIYTSTFGYVGFDSFSWRVNDGINNSNIATISINVTVPQYQSPDVDGNGTAEGDDLKMLLGNYMKVGSGGFSRSDIDNSGKVNILDGAFVIKSLKSLISPSPLATPSVSPASSPSNNPSGGSGKLPVKIGTGAYPAITVDSQGFAHIVYAKDGKLVYCKYNPAALPGNECPVQEVTGITQNASYRNDPDIVVDSGGRPHVIGGTGNGGGQYAFWNGTSWVKTGTFNRDTAIAVDGQDNIYVVQRGNSTNYVQVYKKAATATVFTPLTVPQIGAENDHVYTDIDASRQNDFVYIVYRHGLPTKCASLYSSNAGVSWNSSGITADDTEAPAVTVAPDGKAYAICGTGAAFEWTGSGWTAIGKAVSGGTRFLPMLSADKSGNLYASVFGGKYNIRKNGAWIGEKTITGLTSQAKGFMRVAGATNFAYAVWEEGNTNPALDANSASFDIVLGIIQ